MTKYDGFDSTNIQLHMYMNLKKSEHCCYLIQ